MTPQAALARSFRSVTIPTAAAFLIPITVTIISIRSGYLPDSTELVSMFSIFIPMLVTSTVCSWFAWAVTIPRWKRWAYCQVDDLAELKQMAIRAYLVWPEGHFLERTEIASEGVKAAIKNAETESTKK